MKKRWLRIGLVVLVVVAVYGVVIVPQFPSSWEWVIYDDREETKVDPAGVELRHSYRALRWGEHAGKKHGRFRNFWPNGNLYSQGYFEYGVPHALWTSYDQNGRMIQWTQFEGGKQIKHQQVPHRWAKTITIQPDQSK